MRKIPLNMMTLYADLHQRLGLRVMQPGSISTKTDKGKKYLYAVHKDGQARIQKFLGPATDPSAREKAENIRRAEAEAKEMRNAVSSLKRARIPAPTLLQGRILQVMANAGLFEQGMTLVGSVAYQTYACVTGAYLAAAAYATNDLDVSVAAFVAAPGQEDIGSILKRADPAFEPYWHVNDKQPRIFRTPRFQVDIVTRYGRGRKSPVLLPDLGCAAAALSFHEYLTEDVIEVVALYGTGVLARVPSPARFAIHKLICAQQRPMTEMAKKQKDLKQAAELLEILAENDEDELRSELEAARSRGRSWRAAINKSLKELGRDPHLGDRPLAHPSRQITQLLVDDQLVKALARAWQDDPVQAATSVRSELEDAGRTLVTTAVSGTSTAASIADIEGVPADAIAGIIERQLKDLERQINLTRKRKR